MGENLMIGATTVVVAKDALKAAAFYHEWIDAEIVEIFDFGEGSQSNEVTVTILGSTVRIVDANPIYGCVAPTKERGAYMGYEAIVEDLQTVYDKALELGAFSVNPLTVIESHGIKQAIIVDPNGYSWILHEIIREVTNEEIQEYWENEFSKQEAGAPDVEA